MTPGEERVWIAVYAVHVHSPRTTRMSGHLTRWQIAREAAVQANTAVDALRALAEPSPLFEPMSPCVVVDIGEVLR